MKAKVAWLTSRPTADTIAEPHTPRVWPAAADRTAPSSILGADRPRQHRTRTRRRALAQGLGEPHRESGGRGGSQRHRPDPPEPEGVDHQETGLQQRRHRRRRSEVEDGPVDGSRDHQLAVTKSVIHGGGRRLAQF